jgi:hypothetical protein
MSLRKHRKWLLALCAAGFLALLVYFTLQHTTYRYEVCITFAGSSHCAVADGQTPEEAVRAAQTIGCALLANGRDENIRCLDQTPDSTRAIAAQ